MQSHLTRRVFRAILNNEPLSSSRCHHRFLHSSRGVRSRKPILSPYHIQRRGLFAYDAAPPASSQSAALPSETGLSPMRDLMRSLADKSRGPTNATLARAFQDFFVARAEVPGVFTSFHAQLLITTWKYLRAHEDELVAEEWQRVFSTENLENVLYVLSEAKCLPESHETLRKVARLAYLELCSDHGFGRNRISRPALIAYIHIQAMNGNPEEARHVVENFWNKLEKTSPSPWLTVMRGFAINDDRYQIERTVELLHEYGIKFDQNAHEELITLLIGQGLLVAVKTLYECPLPGGQQPSIATKEAVVKYAILKAEIAWAEPIVESLSKFPIMETMRIMLLWEAVHKKSAAAILEKAQALVSEDPAARDSLNMSCVNSLVEYANSIKNLDLAIEFAALAPQWGLRPNVQTQLLLLESYIMAGDVNKALTSMEAVQDPEKMVLQNMPLMNKLITMLCLSSQENNVLEKISSFLDPLFENNVRLEADTLAALTHALLYRHDLEGVSELLRPRLGSYDSHERTKIRNALIDFIADQSQENGEAWAAYELLQLAFPETGVAKRTEIMSSFFKRNRSDQAFLVFGNMRQAEDFARRPKPDTYVRCFQGFARTQDGKNVDLVHNMLKLDVQIDLNTRLLNSLMLAYAACDLPEKAMEIFREILQTSEGPSQKTLTIFFKACEKHHNGVEEAVKMFNKIKLLEITIDRQMYMAYVEALAAQCEFSLATEALDEMHSQIGYQPTRNSYVTRSPPPSFSLEHS
ncbi:mitochondrial respiratory complex I chaperone [Aspergillus heteromorphus CBS 117.55]|uniref:Mitochondrial respiratory complex I chaperone n=1 Tax=Aspergillus heteromorphus CBS 117.55 TaxID=1448321 RepID=A0A317X2U9_9EURO|nr:mitochondrial respiratory complex I chaperone [Aspergillus heteromorphus CBS 117.55]PWY92949.1 mitochondrial respiratory complex I chaperone [Aspergillus heteromorphus CBS 117.55]